MSANANLLISKQKALEKERERLKDLLEEEQKIQSQYAEVCEVAKNENWYPKTKYYR